jgi:hypothetical protein
MIEIKGSFGTLRIEIDEVDVTTALGPNAFKKQTVPGLTEYLLNSRPISPMDAASIVIAEVERLRAELRLARAVIHELAWGPDTITDRPRLRDALKAWGEADKADLPPEGEQP